MSGPPSYESHRFRSSGGRLNLHARIYPGDGPDLLLMHGLTRNSADFEPLAEHLAGKYRLIVPDQRGRGLSDWDNEPANYRPDIYCADMFALLDGLGIKSACLLGTSMGGLVAMLMGVLQPQRISAIVFNDIGPRVEPAGLARIQGYVGAAPVFSGWQEAADRCAMINGTAFPDYTDGDWIAFARRTCVQDKNGTVRFAYDPAIASPGGGGRQAEMPDLWSWWDLLALLPILVVRGELSDVLAARTVDQMARRHAGVFERIDVPGRGHAPLLDEPAAVEAIEHFLSRCFAA